MRLCRALAAVLLSIVNLAGAEAAERVDLVVTGGTVVTLDGSSRVIESGAVAVRNGRIVAVGTASAIDASATYFHEF